MNHARLSDRELRERASRLRDERTLGAAAKVTLVRPQRGADILADHWLRQARAALDQAQAATGDERAKFVRDLSLCAENARLALK
jgi:hypothetical protein